MTWRVWNLERAVISKGTDRAFIGGKWQKIKMQSWSINLDYKRVVSTQQEEIRASFSLIVPM